MQLGNEIFFNNNDWEREENSILFSPQKSLPWMWFLLPLSQVPLLTQSFFFSPAVPLLSLTWLCNDFCFVKMHSWRLYCVCYRGKPRGGAGGGWQTFCLSFAVRTIKGPALFNAQCLPYCPENWFHMCERWTDSFQTEAHPQQHGMRY